jgi:hypothetical protein
LRQNPIKGYATAEKTVEVFFQGAEHSYEKIVTSEN